MIDSSPTPVLAIDGGGTRCRVALGTGDAITAIETGSANVSTDFDGSVRQILEGLDRLAERLAWPLDRLTALPAFVGLAGVTGPAIAERLRAALPLARVRIEDDRPAALRGALGRRDGAIAHCGTGSFYAAQIGSDMRFSGGWGPVLGDEASAQWIGRTALRMTLETTDGRIAPAPFGARLLADLDGPAGIVRFAGTARPTDFGAIAPLVTEFAQGGDALARAILRLGADEILRGLRHIGWQPGRTLCLTGGIGPHYAAYLPDEMRACIAPAEGEPLDGALSLARDLAQETQDERR